jgi:hypothetical protein
MDVAHGNLQRSQRPVIYTLTADVWGILKVFRYHKLGKLSTPQYFQRVISLLLSCLENNSELSKKKFLGKLHFASL